MYFGNSNVPTIMVQGILMMHIELQEDENGRKGKSIEKFYRDGN